MNENLQKRIFTSILLLLTLIIGIFINKYIWLILLVLVSSICFIEFKNILVKININHKKIKILIYLILLFYLLFFIYSAFQMHLISKPYLIIVLMICILSDTGGYTVGKLVGGKKLTKISPNKTISGSLGSFIFSIFPLSTFIVLEHKFINIDFINFDFKLSLIICLILSLVCQIGDLFISYFKRLSDVKDTGNILPGHGGLLDRIDGVIFVIPVAFIILKLFLI